MKSRAANTGLPLTLAASLCALLLLPAGCPDNRISLATLRQVEAQRPAPPPQDLERPQVTLADVAEQRVASGDVLSLRIVGLTGPLEESHLRVRVQDDGRITLPMVGELGVESLTLAGVERVIREAYVPGLVRDLTVFASVEAGRETTVLVQGAAGRAGLVTLPPNKRNILYAVASAEGFSKNASRRIIHKPARHDRAEQSYNLADMNDLRRAVGAPPLETGDFIFIEPSEPSVIYLTGLLNRPGPLEIRPDSTLSLARAVSAAGGLKDFLEPREATLWRVLPSGEQVRVKLDLASIMAGKSEDLALLPGDILDVPHTPHTRFRQWLLENVLVGPFGVTAVYDPMADRRARILADDDNDRIAQRALLDAVRQSAGTTTALLVR
ncbi:MAG: polysaccharide biosynthesis/export family protein [Phycisphaerae bacterium]|nr:polysaccharide biosynthesis/export family protein [Phycisphaerae bacterium]MCZ2399794.1 polysaccharide biosynthesis/export family protein [Phycisphaerae bacterium]NUQ49015.1 polysaccharide biosynthesis/export family protein [Phycisphaerae bacterium]